MIPAAPLFAREFASSARWRECHKGTVRFVELADGHYTRETPGSNQCCRPGVNLSLVLADGSAAWNVWRPVPEVGRKDCLEAWECTLFRNVGKRLSSELVTEATAITFRKWGWPPKDGFISAVGVSQTRRRRSKKSPPGKCFIEAGWVAFEHPSKDPAKVWLRAPHPVRTAMAIRILRNDDGEEG